MARIRTIKPSFWKHEELSSLPPETHMLAAALLNYADDDGYFNANPTLVKAECFPLRNLSVSVHTSLSELSNVGFIRVGHTEGGRCYGQIIKFRDHQNINRPYPSKIKDLKINWGNSLNVQCSVTDLSSLEERIKKEEKRNGIEKDSLSLDHEFNLTFWPSYPIKNDKRNALVAFKRARTTTSLSVIMDGLTRYIEFLHWPNAPQAKYAQGWLNGERWNDEYSKPRGNGNGHSTGPVTKLFEGAARAIAKREAADRTTNHNPPKSLLDRR